MEWLGRIVGCIVGAVCQAVSYVTVRGGDPNLKEWPCRLQKMY